MNQGLIDIERRREMKRKMPRVRLTESHTEGATLLPNRRILLERLPKDGVVAEIGAAFGEYTAEILEVNRPRQLHLIDSWNSERYMKGMIKIQTDFRELIAEGRLQLHQGLSHERLPEMPDDFFDWVYIDTNHSYGTTLKELQICNKKVKAGGRIAGHDFCVGNVVDAIPYGVIEACNKFCLDFGWRYEFLTLESHGHFSFCLKRQG